MRAILFDLDGTLLDIDIDVFMSRYFGALTEYSQSIYPGDGLVSALHEATGAMMRPHAGRTNREAFYESFQRLTSVDLHEQWGFFQTFYETRFDALGAGMGPKPGAREALVTALDLGLKVAIATNPMFPRLAVEKRIGWAGLSDVPVHLVTTFEDMHACKPSPDYYREVASMLDVEPTECLMVGDDPALDMPAADTGMRTYFVGLDEGVESDYAGDLPQLAALLPRFVDA